MTAAAKEKKTARIRPVPDAANGSKPKRERGRAPTTFAGQLRELARKHREKLAKLLSAEQKTERKLATLRAKREAAEGPLRDVEEMLARRPELPGFIGPPAPPDSGELEQGNGGEPVEGPSEVYP